VTVFSTGDAERPGHRAPRRMPPRALGLAGHPTLPRSQVLVRTDAAGVASLDVACVTADGRLLGRLSGAPRVPTAAVAPPAPRRSRAAAAAALTLPDRAAAALRRTSERARSRSILGAWRSAAVRAAADRRASAAAADAAAATADAAAARASEAAAVAAAERDCADADAVGALMAALLREAHPAGGGGALAALLSGGRRAEAARALNDVRGSRLAGVLREHFGQGVGGAPARDAAALRTAAAPTADLVPAPVRASGPPRRAARAPLPTGALPRSRPPPSFKAAAGSPDLPRRPVATVAAYAGIRGRCLADATARAASPDRARRDAVAAAAEAARAAAAGPPPPGSAASTARQRAAEDAFEMLAAAQERRMAEAAAAARAPESADGAAPASTAAGTSDSDDPYPGRGRVRSDGGLDSPASLGGLLSPVATAADGGPSPGGASLYSNALTA